MILAVVALWAADAAYIYRREVQIPTSLATWHLADAETKLSVGSLAVLSVALLLMVLNYYIYSCDPLGRTQELMKSFSSHEQRRAIKVDNMIDTYNTLQNDEKVSLETRNSSYATLVNAYYELATMFYEWGWGQSFHFADQRKGETFDMAIKRHEWYLAGRLGLKPGAKVLDVGCGIGGPLRNITEFTQADVTGITINEYQVLRGNALCKARGLQDRCRLVQGDFMHLPFPDNSFDGVYAIEATCHAPRRQGVYGEIYRVLKPGAVFACYEWCLTDQYNSNSAEHRDIKKKIEEGDGLPDMASPAECVSALKEVGFQLVEARDCALDPNPNGQPWYTPLTPSWNIFSQRFQFTSVGMWLTSNLLWVMERVHLAPQGTSKVQVMLQQGGIGCARGGQTGTFTPMYLMVGRKPLN
jgi:sterol 24-C-methyltransferase